MQMELLISSTANPRVKMARSLREKKFRDQSGLFLCEGIHHVGAAFEAGWEVETAFFEPNGLVSGYGNKLMATMQSAGVPCMPVTPHVFETLAEKERTLGIVAVLRKKTFGLESFASQKIISAMVTPQDPGNVGTLLRTLDAIGGGGLALLDGGVDPFHPAVMRASMGSFFSIPTVSTSFDHFSVWAQQEGWHLVGTSARGKDLKQANLPAEKMVLLFGSEQKGLEPNQINACETLVSVPMLGKNTSLNIGVAAGIILYKVSGLV